MLWRGVALAFVASVLAAPSFAADVVRPAPVVARPVIAAISPFEGFYLGGNAGYGWGNRTGCFEFGEFPAHCSDKYDVEPFNYDLRGWLLGGQVGVNHFFNAGDHSLFIGAEVSDDIAAITGHDPFGTGTWSNVGAATAKLGFGLGNWIVYGEAGVGIGSFNFSGGGCQFDEQHSGLVWGVGAEAAVTQHNSVFVKWDRFNFGNQDTACGSFIPIGDHATSKLDVVRVGFNHYFN